MERASPLKNSSMMRPRKLAADVSRRRLVLNLTTRELTSPATRFTVAAQYLAPA